MMRPLRLRRGMGLGLAQNRANRGMGFEMLLETLHLHYKRRKIGDISKQNPPVKILDRHGARITGFMQKKWRADYQGAVMPDPASTTGIPVVFEAKSSTQEDRNWGVSGLEPQQRQSLEDSLRYGPAFLLLKVVEGILGIWPWAIPHRGSIDYAEYAQRPDDAFVVQFNSNNDSEMIGLPDWRASMLSSWACPAVQNKRSQFLLNLGTADQSAYLPGG